MGVTLRSYSADRVELTPRMLDVLASASRGRTAIQTAAELHVSASTVNSERAAALDRLGASNVTEAVAIVIRRGELQ
jgi:DNA-binding NarL/FixJ family response regulator